MIFYFSILYELGRCNGRHNYLNELSSRSIPFHFIHSARSLKYLSNLENAVNIGRAILDIVLKLLKSEGIRVFGYFGFLHFHHSFSFRFFQRSHVLASICIEKRLVHLTVFVFIFEFIVS